MAKMRFTEQFLDDAATIYSPTMSERLGVVLHMLEQFPQSGSPQLPAAIVEEFGEGVRKCAFGPFDLIYDYDKAQDTVTVYGLVPQKMAY